MNNLRILIALSLLICIPSACSHRKDDRLKLWYQKPAVKWEEALPIGNGRLGAMVFGGITEDHIQFNEETLWSGAPHDYSHKGAFNYLEQIRRLIWAGKQKEAEDLALENFMSIPLHQERYQPFGDLWITFSGQDSVIRYRRELDLSDAACRIRYQSGGVTYTREYIASSPDNIIGINLDCNRNKGLTFDVSMSALHEGYTVIAGEDGTLKLGIRVKDGALFGTAIVSVEVSRGEISVMGNKLHVEQADRAVIWLSAATNFINPDDISGNPDDQCLKAVSAVTGKTWQEVKNAHTADYRKYFDRFSIDLGNSGKERLPTDARIRGIPGKMDNSLAALYVQYSRYLMLSASRPGTYPANLQGIWNDKLDPPWDSKYTVNINTEMNYWPVEILNIPECHEALFKMLEEVVPSGEKVAKEHYKAKGWVLHHNTDLWRGAAPINASNHGIWVSGSGWLSHHFWEHFLYGMDTAFLRERAWKIMKGAARFYLDFLVIDPKTGWLVSAPSNSPENGGLVSGPTMDHEIIKSLFKACIETSQILGADKTFADSLRTKLAKIAPYQIGRFGQLQEWMEDIDDPANKHRHVSHLWGVYPGKEINLEETPALMDAAKTSLVARGDEGTGWSLAWKINFWARFRDGNHAWQMVQMLLRPEGRGTAATTGGGSSGGGSYPNLFDAHPPFQIDGNFGGAAGIAEMLMQSHLGAIDILPALPDGIPRGHIRGMRARGGFELEFDWAGGKLTTVKVISNAGLPLKLRYKDKSFSAATRKGEILKFNGDLVRI
ncbi:MAG: glycoside hydrolase family 95 protein [Bacteroidota bacterium]|nr:glycoside hydrolase family 95 protein [Bacteroidota bacterium]